MVIGIDEVGRGCWAGPLLVVAARQQGSLPAGLQDSKKLSKKQRELLFADIQTSCELGEGWVGASEIDLVGLTGAMRLGVQRALISLNAGRHEEIIMDGHINYCEQSYANVRCIIRADSLHPIVSAASIYAKVLRDRYMEKMSDQFPKYQFAKHVGYGTMVHRQALKENGVCELHRLSYKPIRALLS